MHGSCPFYYWKKKALKPIKSIADGLPVCLYTVLNINAYRKLLAFDFVEDITSTGMFSGEQSVAVWEDLQVNNRTRTGIPNDEIAGANDLLDLFIG